MYDAYLQEVLLVPVRRSRAWSSSVCPLVSVFPVIGHKPSTLLPILNYTLRLPRFSSLGATDAEDVSDSSPIHPRAMDVQLPSILIHHHNHPHRNLSSNPSQSHSQSHQCHIPRNQMKKTFQPSIPLSPSAPPPPATLTSPPPAVFTASSSTPATSAPTPQPATGLPQTPRSPSSTAAAKTKAPTRVETAPSVAGAKHPPQEEVATLTSVALRKLK